MRRRREWHSCGLKCGKPHVSPAQIAGRDVSYREKAFARELGFGRKQRGL